MEETLINLAILAPTVAIRVGLSALLAADERLNIIGQLAGWVDLAELVPAVDMLVAAAGVESLRQWAATSPKLAANISLLWLTDDPLDVNMLRDLPLQGWGVLSTDATQGELLVAIQALYLGLVIAPPEFLAPLLPAPVIRNEDQLIDELTERESEVLQLLAQGLPNKQIALELEISEHTVKFHISSIYGKLGVTNRTEAVRQGLRLGLVLL